MNIFTAIFLGLVQGITEFLPISSSAHLVFFQQILPGFSQTGIVFDLLLHFATTIAVIIYFRESLMQITLRQILLLIVGTIPAALIGIMFRREFEALFNSVFWAGVTLAISGFLNLYVDRAKATEKSVKFFDAIFIGVAQAIAIIPGISRSGATIFMGTFLGIKREEVAKYSFLLSIPAILGASLVELFAHGFDTNGSLFAYVVAALAAGITAYLSIGFLLKTLQSHNYRYFGYYAIILGVLMAVFFR